MTREQAIEMLKEQHGIDPESGHIVADEVLCAMLESLGYHDVVAEWKKVSKWYA